MIIPNFSTDEYHIVLGGPLPTHFIYLFICLFLQFTGLSIKDGGESIVNYATSLGISHDQLQTK